MRKKLIFLTCLLMIIVIFVVKKNIIKSSADNIRYEVFNLDLNYKKVNSPALRDNELYFSTNSKNSGFLNEIVKMDVNTKKARTIYKSNFNESAIEGIEVNKDWLVWVDSNTGGHMWNIMSMNMETGKIQKVFEANSYKKQLPYLYDHYIVWVHMDINKEGFIRILDLNTNTYRDIEGLNNVDAYNTSLYMEDNKIIWSDLTDGKPYYKAYDISREVLEVYPAEFLYPSYAKYNNNKIFSINFNDLNEWEDQSFGYYDINKNKYEEFDPTIDTINRYSLKEDKLAFLDKKANVSLYSIKKNKKLIFKEKYNENKKIPKDISFDYKGNLIVQYSPLNKEEESYKNMLSIYYLKYK